MLENREVPVVLVLLDSSLLLDVTLFTSLMDELGDDSCEFGGDSGLGRSFMMLSWVGTESTRWGLAEGQRTWFSRQPFSCCEVSES